MEKGSDLTIGLIGNPNVGKSSLFSVLTGSRQNIGSTVEKREGTLSFGGKAIRVVDLPGAYSLGAYNKEEAVTSGFILGDDPDAVIQVLDARNLQRNLLMTVYLLEMDAPLVLAINLLDLAEEKGIRIDLEKLSDLLGVPVMPVNVKEKKGVEALLAAATERKAYPVGHKRKIRYGAEVEEELRKLKRILVQDPSLPKRKRNWMALRILEGDVATIASSEGKQYHMELVEARRKSVVHLESVFAKDLEAIMAHIRYGFIGGLAKECVHTADDGSGRRSLSEKMDEIALDRFLGVPVFLLIMLSIFQLAFGLARPISAGIGMLFVSLGALSRWMLSSLGFSQWTISLIVDGIIGGVGNVLVFVPTLGILFALIAVLEDSGYMSRIAYVMDRFMHKIGLHGKAFIPMVLGFGCNVPGIMATRTLENKRDRLLAILMNPFMSCGSRLPTYILFAGIFFPGSESTVILSLYLVGVIMAISVGYAFRKSIFRQLSSPFVIELPAYRMPNLKGVIIHTGERVWAFIKNAGTIITAFSVVVWLLANLPLGVDYGSQQSLAGSLGNILSPVFVPLGFGNWQSSVALLFGLAGKEIIVGTFGTLYAVGAGTAISISSLQGDFTPLSAYSFLVFVLLYTPCVATLATIRKETGSWKWTSFIAVYTSFIAWVAAFAVYQGGRLLGLN